MPHVSDEVVDQTVASCRGDIASTQISERPLPSFVRSCSPRTGRMNPPSSMYQTASDNGVSCLR